jgi:hypothetical protein
MPGKKTTRARRMAIVARADEVGAVQAAGEFGVNAATIRSWRARFKQAAGDVEPAPSADAAAETTDGYAEVVEIEDLPPLSPDALERMRALSVDAHRVAARAVGLTDRLLQRDRADQARNAAAAGGIWSDKALKLDAAIAEAEDRRERQQAELGDDLARQLSDRMLALLAAFGLSVEHETIRAVVRAALTTGAVPDEMAERARETAASVLAGPVTHGDVLAVQEPVEVTGTSEPEQREISEHAIAVHPDAAEQGDLAKPVKRVRTRGRHEGDGGSGASSRSTPKPARRAIVMPATSGPVRIVYGADGEVRQEAS